MIHRSPTQTSQEASRAARGTLTVGALGGISLLMVLAITFAGGWGDTTGLQKAGFPVRTSGISEMQRGAPIVRYEVRRQQRQAERPPIALVLEMARRGRAGEVETNVELPSRQVMACERMGPWLLNLPPPARVA